MVNRWTVVSQRMAARDDLRTEDVQRRSSGSGYLAALPFAIVPVLYLGVAWIAALVLSPLRRVGRFVSTRVGHSHH